MFHLYICPSVAFKQYAGTHKKLLQVIVRPALRRCSVRGGGGCEEVVKVEVEEEEEEEEERAE